MGRRAPLGDAQKDTPPPEGGAVVVVGGGGGLVGGVVDGGGLVGGGLVGAGEVGGDVAGAVGDDAGIGAAWTAGVGEIVDRDGGVVTAGVGVGVGAAVGAVGDPTLTSWATFPEGWTANHTLAVPSPLAVNTVWSDSRKYSGRRSIAT
jgi:hypothetical protein